MASRRLGQSQFAAALGALLLIGVFLSSSLWLRDLLVDQGFIPHGHCFFWLPELLILHVGSDAVIFVSYMLISLTLVYLVRQLRDAIPFPTMFLAFGCFIFLCGLTHLLAIVVVWNPVYWIDGAIKAACALASAITAILLPGMAPRARALINSAKEAEELREQNGKLVEQLEKLYAEALGRRRASAEGDAA